MKDGPFVILSYIHKHLNARFDSELIGHAQLDKFEVNEILFNLIHEELITDNDGTLHLTQKGTDYLKTLKK